MDRLYERMFLVFLILPLLLLFRAGPVEADGCDCESLGHLLKEAQTRFSLMEKSEEKNPRWLLLECLGAAGRGPDPLFNYCVRLVSSSDGTPTRTAYEKEIKTIQGLLEECKKAAPKCGKWRERLSDKCSKKDRQERGNCFVENGLMTEYKARFPRESMEFIRTSDARRDNIESFLRVREHVCEKKYNGDPDRLARCLANFTRKYDIQPLLELARALGPKKRGSVKQTPAKPQKGDNKDKGEKGLESVLVGRWVSREVGCMLGITNTTSSLRIECLAGCGHGEKFDWVREGVFTRKYTKSSKLGTGYFNEVCDYSTSDKEFLCNGSVRFVGKYGVKDTRRLKARHFKKLLDFQ